MRAMKQMRRGYQKVPTGGVNTDRPLVSNEELRSRLRKMAEELRRMQSKQLDEGETS